MKMWFDKGRMFIFFVFDCWKYIMCFFNIFYVVNNNVEDKLIV